jgi:ABC-type branched-subunit amino acid transport system substrate-binding protein
MRTTRWRLVAVLLALGLLAAACGGGRSDSDDAEGDDGSSDTTEVGTTTDGFGDLASPCGPAAEGTTNSATGDQGVTADSVTIGYGDDAGYQAAPGLNKEMSEAVEALIGWCNDQGGINGRSVVGNYYDAAILNAGTVMQEACGQVFMLVGQGWALDGGAEETRVGCELPQVPGYTVSATVAHGPWTYVAVPNPVDYTPTGNADLFAQAYPEEVKKAAAIYADFAANVEVADKVKATYPDWGWEFLPECEQTYPIAGVAQWAPYIQKLKDCGAEVVYFVGSPLPNFQNFLDTAVQADYAPKYMTDANFYVQDFANANVAGNADEVYMRMAFTPFEQAESNPATQQYVDLVRDAGGEPALLGAQAASAFLMWATAAKECGADLTRQCVLDELAKIDSWTGGGLHADTNPAENLPPECVMVLQMQGTAYVQAMPEAQGEFACDPAYVTPVTDIPAIAAAQLDADRKSTLYGAQG